jgi:hypothetical protein
LDATPVPVAPLQPSTQDTIQEGCGAAKQTNRTESIPKVISSAIKTDATFGQEEQGYRANVCADSRALANVGHHSSLLHQNDGKTHQDCKQCRVPHLALKRQDAGDQLA